MPQKEVASSDAVGVVSFTLLIAIFVRTPPAVATTALGTAMKALPIIALIASIGTLVYGLYQYATATDEADKNEKKRKANLEALKKAEKEQTETIAKESSEFVGLIVQLKATNAGTKERETLIKQINSTYGTTLKNLSDEAYIS